MDIKALIADSLFLQYGKSAKLGGPNAQIPPSHFEWEWTEPKTARFVTDSDIKHAEGPEQIAFLLETFFLHPENYMAALEKPFDYVLTHNQYFAQHKENWLWYPHGGSWVGFDDWKVYDKSKLVSILLSPKQKLWGHKTFHKVVEKFGDKMDIFGLDYYANKLEALAPYRYAVIIEAERSDSFFSEKLIDCLSVGTIPIYWGCPNIGDFFDAQAFIEVESFPDLEYRLEHLSPAFYTFVREKIENNLELAKDYRIPEDWIFTEYPFLFE
jgi:hypothetical protein